MRSIKTMEERFWARVDKSGPTRTGRHYEGLGACWIRKGANSIGFPRSHLIPKGQPKRILVWRYSWTLHNGPIPDGLIIRHKCDNGHINCVNPEHIELGTQADNVADHYKRRTKPDAILLPRQIEVARRLYEEHHVRTADLAVLAHVSVDTMRRSLREGGVALERRERVKALNVTDDETQVIIKRAANGDTVGAIAGDLGRSWGAVRAALVHAGVDYGGSARRRVSEDEVQRVVDLMNEGVTLHAASADVGRPLNTMRRHLEKRGLLTRPKQLRRTQKQIDETCRKAVTLLEGGMLLTHVARDLGVKTSLLGRDLEQRGLRQPRWRVKAATPIRA